MTRDAAGPRHVTGARRDAKADTRVGVLTARALAGVPAVVAWTATSGRSRHTNVPEPCCVSRYPSAMSWS